MSEGGMYGRRAAYYDAIYHSKDYAAEARRLEEILAAEGVAPGSRLLEAGCGTGAHLAHLRGRYDVAGFDLSEDMLAIARAKLPGVPLFRADMADGLPPASGEGTSGAQRGEVMGGRLERPFDALLCLFSAIGYVHPEERLRAAARSFAQALRPGGALVVEPWLAPEAFKPGTVHMNACDRPDLKLCRMSVTRREGDLSVIDFEWMALRASAPEVERFSERHTLLLCPRETLLAAFRDAGFDARFEPDGFMKDRGLVIGKLRPEAVR